MSKWLMFALMGVLLAPLFATHSFVVQTFPGPDGRLIDKITVPGIPVEQRDPGPVAVPTRSAVMLSGVPAFDWSYGCSATSAAMMAGYYDRRNFGHVYSGPTNGGVMPLNNSTWGAGECPLSATHQGYDGLATPGHVNRFWTNNSGSDPFGTGNPTGTYFGCTADYMGTNQDWWGNSDGSTTFYNYVDGSALYDPQDGTTGPPYGRDGIHGLKLFFESRGYSISTNYNQYIYGWGGNTIGYTLDQYKASINAGMPVLIQIEGHTMVGIGYETTSSTIYVLNTWDYSIHTMTWGGVYSGMTHYGVSVLQLNAPPSISINNDSLYASLQPGQTGTDSFIISNTGTGPLTYNLDVQEIRIAEPNRSIAGSTLTLNATQYSPGTTLNWTFSVYNGGTDDEWLKHVYVTFPAGVTVNSATNFIGGGGGDMVPTPSSGNGVTIDWFGESGGWGVVYPGHTATATVSVTIGETLAGTLNLPYQINGDVYGAEPHVLTGTISLPQTPFPVSWFHPLPLSGVIAAGQSKTVTSYFSSAGLPSGSYEALITLNSNDPYTPSQPVTVLLEVLSNAPVISSVFKSSTGMTVDWNPVSGATQYKVYRSFNAYGSFSLLTTTTQTIFNDTSVNRKAFYRITAVF